MSSTTVTARMSLFKKEQGKAVFDKLGITTSDAINSLFDYAIKNQSIPCGEPPLKPRIKRDDYLAIRDQLRALRICHKDLDEGSINVKEWKKRRLEERGLM